MYNSNYTLGNCIRISHSSGHWFTGDCSDEYNFICFNPPQRKLGSHVFLFGNDSLQNPTFQFWWNSTGDGHDSKLPFQLSWHIENGSLPDVKELRIAENMLIKASSGSISTPGLGSITPPNYYKERHEYTAVIELPYNITEVIGSSSLVVDVDVTNPDDQMTEGVEFLTSNNPKLSKEWAKRNWTAAEDYCVSKGGHLASLASPHHWHWISKFIHHNSYADVSFWIGGRNDDEWTWSDGTKWSWIHSMKNLAQAGSAQQCVNLYFSPWWTIYLRNDSCDKEYYSICSVPTRTLITSDRQLVFIAENLTMSELAFKWSSVPATEENKENPGSVGGFTLKWHLNGQKKVKVNKDDKENK